MLHFGQRKFGRAAQIRWLDALAASGGELRHGSPLGSATCITKIVREIVHMPPPDQIESIEDMAQPLEITFVRSNGNG
jgi:hypothetical protein